MPSGEGNQYPQSMLFPVLPGAAAALGLLALIWLVVCRGTKGTGAFVFDPGGAKGEFGKVLLPMYLDIAKFILGLAAGSIVLLIGSSNFNQSTARPLRSFASPLFVIAMSIIYGVLFMIFLVYNYEHHLHHPDSQSYTRFKYRRNQTLGFSSLACFCVGYVWLVVTAAR